MIDPAKVEGKERFASTIKGAFRFGVEVRDLPKQLWINKDMRKKVQKIAEKVEQHYQTVPFHPPKEKPSNYTGNMVEKTIVFGSL